MEKNEFESLIKPLKAKVLKEEVKKRGLKAGRCPTKRDLALLLPEDLLRELSEK